MAYNPYMPLGLSLIADAILERAQDALEELRSTAAESEDSVRAAQLDEAIRAIQAERESRTTGFGIDKDRPEI